MLLQAGVWVDARGSPVQPQIPATRIQPADYSWMQCFNALIGRNATSKARYSLWSMACSDTECRNRFKSPLCVNGLYTLHRHVKLGREPCVRCHDQEMYFVPPAVSTPVLAATVPTSMSIPVEVTRITDAERLVEVSASVSSLSLQLVSSAIGASAGTSPGNWLSQADRSELDAVGKVLHRLTMKHKERSRASHVATSFAGPRTSPHRLVTSEEVRRSHAAARGVAADDPGPIGLLR